MTEHLWNMGMHFWYGLVFYTSARVIGHGILQVAKGIIIASGKPFKES